MAPPAIGYEFGVAGQKAGGGTSCGGYNDAVGGVAVKWRGETAAVESDLRGKRRQTKAGHRQGLLDPLLAGGCQPDAALGFEHPQFRSEEHTSELQSLRH